ncbi:MAG: UbiA family prenyltransferase [Fusobacteriaceae bacterium]
MNLKKIIIYLRVPSLTASVLPFLVGVSYVLSKYGEINLKYSGLFFLANVLIHCICNIVNNYVDFGELKQKRYYSQKIELGIIFSLSLISVAIGIYLVAKLGLVVLILGIFSFFVAVFYTAGPVPISRTPYGEIHSGLAMGFCITFLSVFINEPNSLVTIKYFSLSNLEATFFVKEILKVFLLSVPLICCIANVMLANNICDVDEDTKINRYTLAFYLGNKKSLNLFKWLYYISYFSAIIMVILKILPLWGIIIMLTFFKVNKNIKTFFEHQSKQETFALSLENYLNICLPIIVILFLDFLLKILF